MTTAPTTPITNDDAFNTAAITCDVCATTIIAPRGTRTGSKRTRVAALANAKGWSATPTPAGPIITCEPCSRFRWNNPLFGQDRQMQKLPETQ